MPTATNAWCPKAMRRPASAGPTTTAPPACACPAAHFAARRVEHRVAGGDVNPYLFLAAVLGSALIGIEDEHDAAAADLGQRLRSGSRRRSPTPGPHAIDAFEDCPDGQRIFPQLLIDNLVMTKRQELHYLAELSPSNRSSSISTPSEHPPRPLAAGTLAAGARSARGAKPAAARRLRTAPPDTFTDRWQRPQGLPCGAHPSAPLGRARASPSVWRNPNRW